MSDQGTGIKGMAFNSRSAGKWGFFGCASGNGEARVVRTAWTGEGKPQERTSLDCPVCHQHHQVELSWRKPTELDEGREAEITLGDPKEEKC